VVTRIPKVPARAWATIVAAAAGLTLWPPEPPAGAAPTAAALYQEAMATTNGWRVHYVSTSDTSHVPFAESGDTGPASGTQAIHIGKGSTLDEATLVVIGDLTFVKGNERAMEDLTGLAPAQARTAMNHWIAFSSNNPVFAQVVVGVRSHDVAAEVALQGPYRLGPSRRVDGYTVDAVEGTQKAQGTKSTKAILYVRATGRHQLVEEETVNASGRPSGAEHIVFSKWGEVVRPRAPVASLTLGSISSA
jgi:hypothetical protein